MREHVAQEVAQVVSPHDQIVNDGQRLGRFILRDAVDDSRQHVRAGDTQRLLDVFSLDFLASETDYLIEGRLRIAH